MTPNDPAGDPLAALVPAPPRGDARLSHLFRASLKNGRIHPLYLPVLRYRHARAGEEGAEPAAASEASR